MFCLGVDGGGGEQTENTSEAEVLDTYFMTSIGRERAGGIENLIG